jgi:hypothetical protein
MSSIVVMIYLLFEGLFFAAVVTVRAVCSLSLVREISDCRQQTNPYRAR